MTHDHDWVDVTTAESRDYRWLCATCGATTERPRHDEYAWTQMVADPASAEREQYLKNRADTDVVGTVVPDPDNGIPWMPDIRCPHHTPAGQCLDHQGHPGDHQYPQETR